MSTVLHALSVVDVLFIGLCADGTMDKLGVIGFIAFAGIGMGLAAVFCTVAEYMEREVRYGDDR